MDDAWLDQLAAREHTIALRDGRRLSWAEHGAPDGEPIVYCHGFPGSRVEAAMAHERAQRLGLRVIAPDRPGMGRSSPQPGRSLLDWASDVAELADALGLARFALVGVSGGGPYALACARAIPERLTAVGVAGSLAPIEDSRLLSGMLLWNRVGLRAARVAPWAARPALTTLAPLMRRVPGFFVRRLAREVSAPDREVLCDERVRRILAASFRESFRAGGAGPASDGRLYARPWGFALGEVRAPVQLWHGERDLVVPVAMGRRLAVGLPHCEAHFEPEEGHLSLVFAGFERLARRLLERA